MINNSLAIFLVNEDVRAIGVAFNSVGKFYTYKTLDKSIKVGDTVLVKAKGELKPVEVKTIDIQDTLNFEDTSIQYTWIVGKVDLVGYEDIQKREQALIKELNSLIFKGKKSQVLEALKNNNIDLKQLESFS